MLALGLVAAVPALSQVSFEVEDSENESGGIVMENNFEITGNNNGCLTQVQAGQSGNATNQQGGLQYDADTDDFEVGGQGIELTPEQEQACEQQIQQAAAAGSGKAAPAEKKEEKKAEAKVVEAKADEVVAKAEAPKKEEKKEEKKELPKSGGTGSASLLALGAGALLGGGLLARRFVR
jgi:LPXTG-motif cell wall-anchored protein